MGDSTLKPQDVFMKLVLIEWLDSHAGRGWQDFEDIQKASEPLYCRSVGWIATEGKDCIVLVPHLAGERNGDIAIQGSGDITIPNGAVINITTLERGPDDNFARLARKTVNDSAGILHALEDEETR